MNCECILENGIYTPCSFHRHRVRLAVEDERQACADLVEDMDPIAEPVTEDAQRLILKDAATQIRDRKKPICTVCKDRDSVKGGYCLPCWQTHKVGKARGQVRLPNGMCCICDKPAPEGKVVCPDCENFKPGDKKYEQCDRCGQRKPDVHQRANGYRREINNEPDAEWTACDACNQENNWDI